MKIRRSEVAEARASPTCGFARGSRPIPQIPPPVHSDGDVRDYFERVVLAEQEVWVAEADGVVVALLTLNGDWIEQKYVDPDYWGRRH